MFIILAQLRNKFSVLVCNIVFINLECDKRYNSVDKSNEDSTEI